jgi:hypothetical protein
MTVKAILAIFGAVSALAVMAGPEPPAPSVDARLLPLGDGRISGGPRSGHVYTCPEPRHPGGPRPAGAWREGPWIFGNQWDPALKPAVRGSVLWPEARFAVDQSAGALRLRGNGLPINHPTGQFPIAADDPAYTYDPNPNRIRLQTLSQDMPTVPQFAAVPGCVPMGAIGVMTSGVALYSAVDEMGRDAAAHEVQDRCNGHPQQAGEYHYHNASPCLSAASANEHIGWAIDGFPILGMQDAAGRQLTNADLDTCHGRREEIVIDGRRYGYSYRLTREYPYSIGCFMGQVAPGARRPPVRSPPMMPPYPH